MNSAFNSDVALCSAAVSDVAPRALSSSDRLAAESLITAKQSVISVFEDPLLKIALHDRGYDRVAIASGEELGLTAEAEFVQCQVALDELDEAKNAFQETWTATREDYVEFRGIIRSLFAPSECSSLFNVYGQIAPELIQFTAQATISYTRALEIRTLERAGYDVSWLHTALGALQNLIELDAVVRQRTTRAAQKSAARNRALAQYTSWVSKLILEARRVTSGLQKPPARARADSFN